MPFVPLACQEIILRALLRRGWFDEDSDAKPIKADAFILDRGRDKDGLSVVIQSRTDLEAWLRGFSRSYGADKLHTGKVRTLGLDVGQTEEDLRYHPGHAVITGLPFTDDDPGRAESLASQLAKMSRPVDRTVRKQKKAVTPLPAAG